MKKNIPTNKTENQRQGFLDSEIKFFYLKDQSLKEIDFHYHDFHKVLILLHGNLDYQIEGCQYSLKENDIILVPAGKLHRPILKPCDFYERLIIYVSDEYLRAHSDNTLDLRDCLTVATTEMSYCFRPSAHKSFGTGDIIAKLIEESMNKKPGCEISRHVLFLQLMVELNRCINVDGLQKFEDQNDKISQVIEYVNLHLTEDISIDSISKELFISRYYLMHSFKEKTGYTLGNFISSKRLYLADRLIAGGMPITKAAYECGYNSYSAFFRAYKKLHEPGNLPSQEL